MSGRQRILQEARRLLSPGGVLAVIDIATDYEPSPSMLAGEPYGKYRIDFRMSVKPFWHI